MRAAGPPHHGFFGALGSIFSGGADPDVLRYAIADVTSGDLLAAIDGFAAGALLVMLIDSMIPEAAREGGRAAGLVTVLGFSLAAGLSGIA